MKRTSKICTSCKMEKSIESDFYKVRKKRKNKTEVKEYEVVREKCKDCCRLYSQSRRDLRYYLPRLYGITEQQYDDMRQAQQYRCKICSIHEDEWFEKRGRRLFVDHCHNTDSVRGLLCGDCNTGLGQFKDNVQNLQKAIEYLNETLS